MKEALITGGCGFVGRHFARRLLDDGWRVTVVDDLSTGIAPRNWAFQSNFSVNLSFELSDVRTWMKVSQASEWDLVIHCAAIVGGRAKIEGDPLGVATDLAIDADFFNWVVKTKGLANPKVIYFSSSAVYPIVFQQKDNFCRLHEALVNLSEEGFTFDAPDMTYGWAKLTGELLASYAQKQGVDVAVYRPFSGYGEDQSLDYPFPALMQRIAYREDPLTIWGNGTQVRDFIHIDDIIDAVLDTYQVLPLGIPLNLGSGEGMSFLRLVQLAGNLVGPGYRAFITVQPDKPTGVHYRVADIARLTAYNFRPKISLEEGILRSLQFFGLTFPTPT